MPIEGQTDVVDQNAGGTPNNDGGNKDAGTPKQDNGQQKPTLEVKPDAAGKTRDYDKEIGGLRADLQKERKARQQYETNLKTREAELDTERKRVAAALGITQKSGQEQEEDQIRERFKQLYPELAGLTKEDIEALRELKATAGNLKQTTDHYWSQHSTQMVSKVQSAVQKEIGGTLSDRQKARIERAYATEVANNEDLLERHARGDDTLVKEFADQWIADWFEPARRKVTQTETQRFRAVPSGKDRGIITQGEKKIDVNDNDAVMNTLVKGFKERGGTFGRP